MELASMLAGEPFSDHPRSACPVIGAFLRAYNDGLPDDRRQDLYAYAAKVVGTASGRKVRRARARLCLEWFAEQTPGRRLARTLLTATGIGVGVAAIVSLIALGDGLKQSASGFIHLGRADVGILQKGVSDPTASVLPTSMAGALEKQEGVAEATPIQLLIEVIPHEPSAIVFGIDPSSFAGQRLVMVSGRRASGPGQVIVGDQLAKQAKFQPGTRLKIKDRTYTVTGIFHSGVTF